MEPASSPPWLGLIELFVVLLFVLAWGVLELVCKRMDRRREAEKSLFRKDGDEHSSC
jgi:hypothetical protein